jgi:hypothetical protein
MAAAGLWTTPTDLAKFAIEVGRAARGVSNKVLDQDMAKLMVTKQIAIGGTRDMALGLFLERHGSEVYFGHGGQDEGFIAMLASDRDEGYGAAVMTNSDGRANALIGEMMMSVAKEYGWRGYVPPAREVVALDARALAPFAGRYVLDSDRTVLVKLEGGRLTGKITGEPALELLPVSATEFIVTETPLTFTFAEAKGGPSAAVTLRTDSRTATAARAPEGFKAPADWLEEGDAVGAVEGYRALFQKDPKDPNVAEGRLNAIGYGLMDLGKMPEALALFKLNVEFHPDSWNAYDSLAEGCMRSGDKAQAVKFYEKSLALNPKNTGAAKKLADLKNK